jgi:MYXO-CTERM domain-containing protein
MTLATLLLASTLPVQAWNHTYWVWDQDQFPLEWYMSDYNEDSLPSAYSEEALVDAWAHWEIEAPCAKITSALDPIRVPHIGYEQEGLNVFTYDDPKDDLGTGVLGQTRCYKNGEIAFNIGGETYEYAWDCDVIFNTDIDWETTEAIESGCTKEYSIEAVATHEIGHLLGMGHSCEEGDPCPELDERYATMYWSIGACSTYQAELKDDDIEGITALYGPYATFDSDSKLSGGAPLDVCFCVERDEGQTDVAIEWQFGDGPSVLDSELADCPPNADGSLQCGDIPGVVHTYTSAGQFTVSMEVEGTSEECASSGVEDDPSTEEDESIGSFTFTQRELAYVTVCDKPIPADGFQGMFSYEHVDGLVYQMVNQVDTSVYGCVERIRWDVFQGGDLIRSISAWSPKIEFPKEGEYRVVLNVAAPGAQDPNKDLVAAHELLIDAEDKKAGGCSTAPTSGGFAGLLIGLLGLATRRRQR